MIVTFTIRTTLPDDATNEQLDSILTDAFVQVDEPNEEVGLEASNSHARWWTSTARDSGDCCDLARVPAPSTVVAVTGSPEYHGTKAGCICSGEGEDGMWRDCRSTGCDPECPACEEQPAPRRDVSTAPAICASGSIDGRCISHPAYDADYCPRCGTAAVIPGTGGF